MRGEQMTKNNLNQTAQATSGVFCFGYMLYAGE